MPQASPPPLSDSSGPRPTSAAGAATSTVDNQPWARAFLVASSGLDGVIVFPGGGDRAAAEGGRAEAGVREAPMRSRTLIRLLALASVFTLATMAPSTAGPFTRSPLKVVSGSSPFAGCDISGQPGVTFSPNGDAYQISLSVNMVNHPATAILVSKSSDGGDSWSEPTTLVRDPSGVAPFLFNDKESITADPNDANYAYAVWDRLRFPSDRANFNAQHAFSFRGDAMFARTTDGGATWEPARAIFAPS